MRNQQGMITIDFLFAMVLILGLSSVLFVMTFTLSVASIVQYATFAAARNYGVAHIDLASQEERGQAKYRELIDSPVFKPLFSNGWYKVWDEVDMGDMTTIGSGHTNHGYADAAGEKNQFWGAGTELVAHVLDFQIPFFGSTAPDSDGTGSGFKSYIASYLGREPTTTECVEFTRARWDAIRSLAVSGGASYSSGTDSDGYYPMTDDGC